MIELDVEVIYKRFQRTSPETLARLGFLDMATADKNMPLQNFRGALFPEPFDAEDMAEIKNRLLLTDFPADQIPNNQPAQFIEAVRDFSEIYLERDVVNGYQHDVMETPAGKQLNHKIYVHISRQFSTLNKKQKIALIGGKAALECGFEFRRIMHDYIMRIITMEKGYVIEHTGFQPVMGMGKSFEDGRLEGLINTLAEHTPDPYETIMGVLAQAGRYYNCNFVDLLHENVKLDSRTNFAENLTSTESSGMESQSLDIVDLFIESELSAVTIAPPGSGKSQCNVIPALMAYEGSAIVLDIKGECEEETRAHRETLGKCITLKPSDPQNSAIYNPFDFIRDDPNYVWDDAMKLAEMVVFTTSKSDPFWEGQGRQFLTMIIAFVAMQPKEERNMISVLNLASLIGLSEALETIMESPHFPNAMKRNANKFKLMDDKGDSTLFENICTTAETHLEVWQSNAVSAITQGTSSWRPEDFRGDESLTLYLSVTLSELATFAPMLRVIISQQVRYLISNPPPQDSKPILFMLDELPRLGNMNPVQEALDVGRGNKIKLWMIAQYIGQLNDAYGKDITAGMIESCGLRIYMNPGADIAEKLSRIIGKKEDPITGKMRDAVTAQDLMGEEWSNDMLVFRTGKSPLRIRKKFHYQNQ